MSVGTAVTTKCLVAQETAGWGEGGGARQLVPHKAGSINIISPKLGRAARNWNCSLGNTAPSACSPSDQSAPLGKGREMKTIRSLLKGHLLREASPGHPISEHNLHPTLILLTFLLCLSFPALSPPTCQPIAHLSGFLSLFLLGPELHKGRVCFIHSSIPSPQHSARQVGTLDVCRVSE